MKKNLQQLDELVAKGNILEAFDKFFHDNVVTWSSKKDKTTSKQEKRDYLVTFFDSMKSTDDITFHGSVVDGSTSYSKFTFIFTNQKDERLKWHEIIRRKWEKGLVVDEYYYHENFKALKEKIEKKKAKSKSTVKEEANDKTKKNKASKEKPAKSSKSKKQIVKAVMTSPPAIAMKVEPILETKKKTSPAKKEKLAETQKADPKIEKPKGQITKPKPVMTSPPAIASKVAVEPRAVKKSTTTRKSQKSPDLTIIDGIGPKIMEILGQEGISTFAQVAASKAEDIKNIMINRGGTRYNANNPETWPEQASLAAEGKWDELAALKSELKHGKRV